MIFRFSAASRRLRPSFLIIGAQRAGTTSLYNYLAEHPLIIPAAKKEVHFFDVNYANGSKWYWSQFQSPPSPDAITGEASPYYIFHPMAAQRAAAMLPDARIIVLLRNPVDRALSHYHHESRRGLEKLSFADALAAENERLKGEGERICSQPNYRSTAHQWHSYRSRGCYMDQLEVWLRYYRRDQMLVLISEEFYADPAAATHQVSEFLGLAPQAPRTVESYEKHNLANYPTLDAEIRDELVEFYRPHNRRLSEFLGRTVGWDRVA